MEEAEAESGVSAWETRFGMRVDVLSACAYLLGPISGPSAVAAASSAHVDYINIDCSAALTHPRDTQ